MLDLLECGEQLTQIAQIESFDFGPELQDLDNDGRPEVIVNDNAFYHRPICRDGTPMPKVILRWHNGKYVPADALMKRATTSTSELAAKAALIRTGPDEDATTGRIWVEEMLVTLFDLFYSDQEKAGWNFLDDAWKPGVEGKEEFAANLRGLLEESDYMQQLATAWDD
jgi:hypothetical protein